MNSAELCACTRQELKFTTCTQEKSDGKKKFKCHIDVLWFWNANNTLDNEMKALEVMSVDVDTFTLKPITTCRPHVVHRIQDVCILISYCLWSDVRDLMVWSRSFFKPHNCNVDWHKQRWTTRLHYKNETKNVADTSVMWSLYSRDRARWCFGFPSDGGFSCRPSLCAVDGIISLLSVLVVKVLKTHISAHKKALIQTFICFAYFLHNPHIHIIMNATFKYEVTFVFMTRDLSWSKTGYYYYIIRLGGQKISINLRIAILHFVICKALWLWFILCCV